jgi:type IV pilus assembly protein PilV
MKTPAKPVRDSGFSLIEILVTMFIVVIGLLGVAGMLARAHVAEFESYQRAQALVLLYDMVDRINNNRLAASCFAITTDTVNGTPYLGAGGGGHFGTPACGASTTQNNTLADNALNDWDALLRGAAEKKGAAAAEVGAMLGARGCIRYNPATEFIDNTSGLNIAGTGEYTIAVSWQGTAETFPPTVACGVGLYGSSDAIRRTVWVTLRQATLVAR